MALQSSSELPCALGVPSSLTWQTAQSATKCSAVAPQAVVLSSCAAWTMAQQQQVLLIVPDSNNLHPQCLSPASWRL